MHRNKPNITYLLTYLLEDNSFWHDQRQANTWTNAEILSIRTLGTNLSEIRPYEIQQMSYFFIQENSFENVV